jgi:hypothetical protein
VTKKKCRGCGPIKCQSALPADGARLKFWTLGFPRDTFFGKGAIRSLIEGVWDGEREGRPMSGDIEVC